MIFVSFIFAISNTVHVLYAAQDITNTFCREPDGHSGVTCLQDVCVEAYCLRAHPN